MGSSPASPPRTSHQARGYPQVSAPGGHTNVAGRAVPAVLPSAVEVFNCKYSQYLMLTNRFLLSEYETGKLTALCRVDATED